MQSVGRSAVYCVRQYATRFHSLFSMRSTAVARQHTVTWHQIYGLRQKTQKILFLSHSPNQIARFTFRSQAMQLNMAEKIKINDSPFLWSIRYACELPSFGFLFRFSDYTMYECVCVNVREWSRKLFVIVIVMKSTLHRSHSHAYKGNSSISSHHLYSHT